MTSGATGPVALGPEYWHRVGEDLADDLAVDALDRDRAGKPPDDEVGRIRESGLAAALAPPGAAGRGTHWSDACAIVRRIAAADGSIGELLARHYALSWSARFFATPWQADALEAAAAHGRWLWAGDTGVPGPDQDADPDDGGVHLSLTSTTGAYLLSGHRFLPTAATAADRLVLPAARTGTDETLILHVDPRRPGVSRETLADRTGQRLAGAGSVHFDRVPVDAAQVLGPAVRQEDEDLAAPFATIAPLALGLMLTHVVLGIAEGALAEARDLGRAAARARRADIGPYSLADSGTYVTASRGPRPAADGAEPDLVLAFGELALAVHSASAVVDRATAAMAAAVRTGPALDPERRADTAALVAASETVTARAALLCGESVPELLAAEGLDRFRNNIRVLAGRGPSDPALRALGDHFLNGTPGSSATWT